MADLKYPMKAKICILVSNDFNNDPRVQRQASSAGRYFETLVLGWMTFEASQKIPEVEKREYYKIYRGIFLPHFRNKIFFFLNLKLLSFSFSFICTSVIKIFANRTYILLRKLRWVIYRVLNQIILNFKKFFYPAPSQKPNIKLIRAVPQQNFEIKINQNSSQSFNNKGSKPALRHPISLRTKLSRLLNGIRFYDYYKTMNQFFIQKGEEFKPDIIHANDLDTLWAGWQIKKKTGAKLIYDAHEIWTDQGLQLPSFVLRLYKVLEKYLFRRIDYFLTVNDSIAQELDKRYHFQKKVPQEVIYNYPQTQKISSFNQKRLNQKIQILYQGRYSFDRGLEQIIEASKFLSSKAEIHFRGVGNEEFQERLKNIVRKNRLEKKVKFLSPVPMNNLIQSAQTADIGIIAYIPTNINNYLCLPNKLFEYMMAGLALAVSDSPELKKIIQCQDNGIVFNPRKPKDIANKLNKLIDNQEKLKSMKANSLKAAQFYTWENEEKKLIKIYRKLYAQKP